MTGQETITPHFLLDCQILVSFEITFIVKIILFLFLFLEIFSSGLNQFLNLLTFDFNLQYFCDKKNKLAVKGHKRTTEKANKT